MEDYKKHIVNILKEVYKGQPNEGETFSDYLDRMASAILSYIPEDKKAEVKKASSIETKLK